MHTEDKPADATGDSPPWMVPDFTLIKRIGRGSYGEVWLARSATGQYRAVKFVAMHCRTGPHSIEREFRGLLAYEDVSRSHPNLVVILHTGLREDRGGFHYVMELADADGPEVRTDPAAYRTCSLDAKFRHFGRLPVDALLDIARPLLDALAHLHKAGLTHRDIKPGNIIFVRGAPKLADIGLIASTEDRTSAAGTLHYAPEDGAWLPSGDLYSLGKVLYEGLTGYDRSRFPELPPDFVRGPMAERRKRMAVNDILLRACAANVEDRYPRAETMLSDIDRVKRGERVPTPRRAGSRIAWRVAVALLLLLAMSAATTAWREWEHQRAMQRRDAWLARLNSKIYGYRPDRFNADLTFTLFLEDHDTFDDGYYEAFRPIVQLSAIRTAHVVGSFNGWTVDPRFEMKKSGPNWFEFTVPRDLLGTNRTHAFKFVVNEREWLTVPGWATNTTFGKKSYNAVVHMPAGRD